MPIKGKFKGRHLADVPPDYLAWLLNTDKVDLDQHEELKDWVIQRRARLNHLKLTRSKVYLEKRFKEYESWL